MITDLKRTLLISISRVWKYSNAGVDMIAGYLREKGYFVDVLYFHQKETLEKMLQIIHDKYSNYDLYGCSVYSSNVDYFAKITEEIKTIDKDKTVIWGGAFPSMYYKYFLRDYIGIDYIILGDGEKPIEFLLAHFGDKSLIDSHNSIVSAGNYSNKFNACNGIINNLPAWDYYEKIVPRKNSRKTHCIQSKNNVCTGICSFCYERKGKIAYKNNSTIISELKYVYDKFGVRNIFFSDDNLLDPNTFEAKERIRLLCQEILKLNRRFAFSCYIKAISLDDTDYDHNLLDLMARAGFAYVFIGIESGNDFDLKLYKKNTTVEDNIKIIQLLEKHSIVPQLGFINYNPYSTRDTLKDNFLFLTKVRSNNLYSYVCTFLNLYEGTKLFEQVKNDGLLKPDYSIVNDMAYYFKNPDAYRIISFVKEYMYDRVHNLPYETGWLLQRCEAAIRINPVAVSCKKRLLDLKEKELGIIYDFFSRLFIDADLDYCMKNVDSFLSLFEVQCDELEEIYSQIQSYATQ